MKIALDYDGTYNRDKAFWTQFIENAHDREHEIFIVTYRHPELDHHEDFDLLKAWMKVETIFTDGNPKRAFCEELGHKFDIWIDDRPESVSEPSAWGPDDPRLAEWRENNRKASMAVAD